MTLENAVRIFAGIMVLISVALSYFVSPWWMLFTIFVGLNLIQSALTGFCPAEMIISRLFFRNKKKGMAEVSSQEG